LDYRVSKFNNEFLVDCKSVFCAEGNFFALKRLVESGEYLYTVVLCSVAVLPDRYG